MNVGLREAEMLVKVLQDVLRKDVPLQRLEQFNRGRQQEWRRLLGVDGALEASQQTTEWVRNRRSRLLACLPGSAEDLGPLLDQLKLSWV